VRKIEVRVSSQRAKALAQQVASPTALVEMALLRGLVQDAGPSDGAVVARRVASLGRCPTSVGGLCRRVW
jgi:hypothetical protein